MRGCFHDGPGKPVVAISLAGSGVTDVEIAHLRDLKSLQSLDLSRCEKVTDAGLPYLSSLTELQELRLGSTGMPESRRASRWSIPSEVV